MLAVLLLCVIFICATTIGFALVSWLGSGRTLLLNALVAPAVGFCAVILPGQFINRLGLPIDSFAPVLIALELALAIFALWRIKPVVPWRVLWPFGIILFGAFLLTCRPLAHFGFGWISYGSTDMPNYAMQAHRLLHSGYYAPTPPGTIKLSDVGPWRILVFGAERSGVEVLLAAVMSITRLNGVEAFMPVICAGYLALVLASGALVARRSSRPWRAYAASAAVAMSSLTTLGTLEQLLGQAFGLAVLAALGALVFDDRLYQPGRRGSIPGGLLGGIVFAGFIAIYPELFPFFAIGIAGYAILALSKRAITERQFGRIAGWASVPSIVILNVLFLQMMHLIVARGQGADRRNLGGRIGAPIFPYFLVPSGAANFWGFVPIPLIEKDPILSIAIAAGLVLLLVLFVVSVIAVWQRSKPALLSCAILLGIVYLFVTHVDYGLYKLMMFVQPFALATLVDLRTGSRRPWLSVAATLAICIAGVPAQQFYVAVSRDAAPNGGAYASVPGASADAFVRQLRDLHMDARAPLIVSDSATRTLEDIETNFAEHPFVYAAENIDLRITGTYPAPFVNRNQNAIDDRLVAAQAEISPHGIFHFGKRRGAPIAYFYALDLDLLRRRYGEPWLLF